MENNNGGIRIDDDDIKSLKEATVELTENDPDEYGGKVEVIDKNGNYILKEESDK